MSSQEFIKTMEYIIQAMREKGYDPYQQLRGYLLENEPGYITRHKNARARIVELDSEQVRKYIEEVKTKLLFKQRFRKKNRNFEFDKGD